VKSESVVIDVTNVQYVDTTFLRFLLRLRRIFEVTGLMRFFDVEYATLA